MSFTRLVNRSWVERLERKGRIKGHKRSRPRWAHGGTENVGESQKRKFPDGNPGAGRELTAERRCLQR